MPKFRVTSQVKANLDLWLNKILLEDGYFSTISVGETNVYGRDLSLLEEQDDPSRPDNTVFQSAFKPWVHESGITPSDSNVTSPIICSGVTVDGVFYPQFSGAPGYSSLYSHHIDFNNGRIIFDSVPAGTTFQAEFSYKEVTVDFSDRFENEEDQLLIELAAKNNPRQTGVVVYPEPHHVVLPSLQIDLTSRTNEPYELGASSTTAEIRGTLILWSRNSWIKDTIIDLIQDKERTVLLGIDFNTAPHPLDEFNDKNPAFTSYDSLAVINGPYFYRRIYIDDIETKEAPPFMNIERARIDFLIRVFANF